MKRPFDLKNPDILLYVLLATWWAVNIIQAGFTELANDEAYYRMFAQRLDWGYFDHPPMIALLVKLGNFMGGELGVRFFTTILQPLYLLLLWKIVRPAVPETKDAVLFFLIASAIPMLQLYGFVATPDAPLMMFSALFLYLYKKFTESDSWGSALLMGVAMAALAYSKYQGALVVIFVVGSNIKLLRNPKFYISCLAALILVAPHLWWQYQHDWASFRYHLNGRSRDFEWPFLTEYILNLVAVFNPFLFPVFLKGWWRNHAKEPAARAMSAVAAGFIVFFLFSVTKGRTQPQWLIPASFGIIAVLFGYVRERRKLMRYTVWVGYITLVLIVLVRIEMIFNPLGIRFEVFDNKASNARLAAVAAGRPIIFDGSYTGAAKYEFYTGGEAYAQPSVNSRTSQYEFMDGDTRMAGKPVIMEYYGDSAGRKSVKLANGREFGYIENDRFIPVRKIEMEVFPALPEKAAPSEDLVFDLNIKNPYPYDYTINGSDTRVGMVWYRRGEPVRIIPLDIQGKLPANGTLSISGVTTEVPASLNDRDYTVGVTIANTPASTWFNTKPVNIKASR